jgi:hypothetical protein
MRRRAALLSLAAGIAVIAAAQVVAPLGSPPLYDGVIVHAPYNYLSPPPGHPGSPTSFRSSYPVAGATSPQFVAATTEIPPQAQLIALAGVFELPAGAVSLTVSIEAVAPPAPPPENRRISGNVYRFAVADQSGSAPPIGSGKLPTLILRSPDNVTDATIWRLSGGAWQQLPTQPSGQPGIWITNVTALGDFAFIEPVVPGADEPGLDAGPIIGGIVATLLAVAILGTLLWRRQRRRGDDRRRGSS